MGRISKCKNEMLPPPSCNPRGYILGKLDTANTLLSRKCFAFVEASAIECPPFRPGRIFVPTMNTKMELVLRIKSAPHSAAKEEPNYPSGTETTDRARIAQDFKTHQVEVAKDAWRASVADCRDDVPDVPDVPDDVWYTIERHLQAAPCGFGIRMKMSQYDWKLE